MKSTEKSAEQTIIGGIYACTLSETWTTTSGSSWGVSAPAYAPRTGAASPALRDHLDGEQVVSAIDLISFIRFRPVRLVC